MVYLSRDDKRKNARRRRHKYRDDWIRRNGPCNSCGSSEDLEIDHILPESKSIEVWVLWRHRKEVRDRELVKCQVLCHACHYDKTSCEQKGVPNPGARRYTDERIKEVINRVSGGQGILKACAQIGVSYSAFNRAKKSEHLKHLWE